MKKKAAIALKVVVTVGLLWYLFGKIDLPKLGENIRQADRGWLALGLAINTSIILFSVWRWTLLLSAQGIPTRFHPVFWATCAGYFFNSVLPGLTGGDLARVYYATQLAPRKKVSAALSVAVDRIVGILGLLCLATLVIVLCGHRLWDNEVARRGMLTVLAASGCAAAAGVVFLGQAAIGRGLRVHSWIGRLPLQGALKHLREINAAYRDSKTTLILTIAMSVVVHILSISCVVCIGLALRISSLGPLDYYLIQPIINAVTAIPVSLGGLGVRENISQIMFGAVGVSAEKAVAISLIYYGIIWLTSLAAGAVYALARPASMHLERISDIMAHESEITDPNPQAGE